MKYLLSLSLLLTSLIGNIHAENFKQVIIWGHKVHLNEQTHTHSFIHNAFFRAFKHLGYKTYWFDASDPLINFDFSNSLFITEGQVDDSIPLRMDCFYILHNCYKKKWNRLKKNTISLQVYKNIFRNIPSTIEVEPFILYDFSHRTIYMPWATDILPFEIDQIKHEIKTSPIKKEREIYWVGSIGGQKTGNLEQIEPFRKACRENQIEFIHKNPWIDAISLEENIKLIQKSYLAPTIAANWQKDEGYIPCRIFKNISYGQFGVTNSREAFDLFQGMIIFNPNEYQLFYDAQNFLQTATFEDLEKQMNFVRDHHTYLNRISHLLTFIKQVQHHEK